MPDEKLLEYFIDQTNERLDKQDAKLDSILKWKWMIAGGTTVISTLSALIVAIVFKA